MAKQSSLSTDSTEKSKCVPCKALCQSYRGTQSSIRATESGSSKYSERRKSRRKSSMAISCSCSSAGGPDVYRRILGPTPDETILAGLQTVIDMCCPQRILGSTRRSSYLENDITSIEEIYKSSGDSLSVISVNEAEMCNQMSQQTQPTTRVFISQASPDNLRTRSTSPLPSTVQNKYHNQRSQAVQTSITLSSSTDHSNCLNERCPTSSAGLYTECTRPSISTCVQTANPSSSSKSIQAYIGRSKKSSVAVSCSSDTKSINSSDSQQFLSSTTCSWRTSSTESTGWSSSTYESHVPCNTSICKAKSLYCTFHRKSRSKKCVCTRKLQSENLAQKITSNSAKNDLSTIYSLESEESQPQHKSLTSSEESISESKRSPTPSRKSDSSKSSDRSILKSNGSPNPSRKSDSSKSSEESASKSKTSPNPSRKSDSSKSSDVSIVKSNGSPNPSRKSDSSKSSEESASKSKRSPNPNRKSDSSKSSDLSIYKSNRSPNPSRKSDSSKSFDGSLFISNGSPNLSRKSDSSKSSDESIIKSNGSPNPSRKSDSSKSSEGSVSKSKVSPNPSRKSDTSKSSEGSIFNSVVPPTSTRKYDDSKSSEEKSESVKCKGSSSSQEILISVQETNSSLEASSTGSNSLIQSLLQLEDTTVKESKHLHSTRNSNHRHLKAIQLAKQPVLLEVIEETYEEPHSSEESINGNVFAGKENVSTQIVKESRKNKEMQSDQDSNDSSTELQTESKNTISSAAKVPYYPKFPLDIICSCRNDAPSKEFRRKKPTWCTFLRNGPHKIALREKRSKRILRETGPILSSPEDPECGCETSDDTSNERSIHSMPIPENFTEKSEEIEGSSRKPEPKINRYKNQSIYYKHNSDASPQSTCQFDPGELENPPGDSTAVRYAIARITTFSQYSTFEILKCKLIPSRIPTCTESIFVLRHK